MNLRMEPHHNICGLPSTSSRTSSGVDSSDERPSEAGYTLVALLAVMTLLALFAMAAAPSIQQQAQREREKEAIFRGEQVADAIRAYYRNRAVTLRLVGDQALPSSMEQLLEGIPIPGGSKTRQILRASAARDPLTASGEWRFIHPRTQSLIDFQRSVIVYAGNLVPSSRDPQMIQLQQFAVPQIVSVLDVGTSDAPSSEGDSSDDSSGPFVGVASKNKHSAVLYYYGIDRHDLWIFTPLFRN